jgi:uncharacterized protein (UPF0548 family)
LRTRSASYDAVGATRPDDERWTARPRGYRAYERTVRIGEGQQRWDASSAALLAWGVKTRSGFTVEPPPSAERVRVDDHFWLVAHLGPFRVREPVRVVAVVDRPDRRGFVYGTLDGHPVAGEEAFVVHRTPDGGVWLTLRSLTRPPSGAWRLAFPGALVAQRWYRRRYLLALT